MNIKKMLLLGMLLGSSSADGGFLGISYTEETKDLTVNNQIWKGQSMAGLKFGGNKGTSFYFDVKGGGESDDNEETEYHYLILNIGMTYTVDNFTFMGGIGYSSATLDYPGDEGDSSNDEPSNDDINFNIGLMYKFGVFGLSIEYDTVPQAMSLGLAYCW